MASRSTASLRWQLLRQRLLPKSNCFDNQDLNRISRRPHGHFGLINFEQMRFCETEDELPGGDCEFVTFKYHIPVNPAVDLLLSQRNEDKTCYSDFSYAKKHQIDMTGLVGLWPAEEVLTYHCVSNASLFRNKRVLELGSGYGLAGLAIAACTEAAQVILTDGNPQIVDYLRANINRNRKVFRVDEVDGCLLHWSNDVPAELRYNIDIVIAADCTFFSDMHSALASSVKLLLKRSSESSALFFNPQRDGSLNSFLETARGMGFSVQLIERYDPSVWSIHESLMKGESSAWYNYDMDHCYPLLAVLKFAET
ncbi:hypothetical protein KP509_28G037600 [Ceratopteris richardii]|uniref:Calmodulin-lysine N-methyltransferase n=1 Tax=Ceratopteris richardii TaxID=49495 RepID=A0A8T2RB91_CERRI|nr:hypothetical protein KP509_28G037600 [Ceratopteris richardii]